jgi:hypothetical protein
MSFSMSALESVAGISQFWRWDKSSLSSPTASINLIHIAKSVTGQCCRITSSRK